MIKNLLFDLGGVIIDIQRSRCADSFRKLGMENPDGFLGEYSQSGPFGDLESGKITAGEFHAILRPLLAPDVTDGQIDAAFNDFLIGIPQARLDALKSLRKRYNVYILSNTNEIMWSSRIAEEFAQQGGSLSDYCDGAVTSFEVKCMKPSPQIFEITCQRFGIIPAETIFLDDSAANTAAAAALGFNTITVAPGNEFMDLLKKHGL